MSFPCFESPQVDISIFISLIPMSMSQIIEPLTFIHSSILISHNTLTVSLPILEFSKVDSIYKPLLFKMLTLFKNFNVNLIALRNIFVYEIIILDCTILRNLVQGVRTDIKFIVSRKELSCLGCLNEAKRKYRKIDTFLNQNVMEISDSS